MKIAIIIAMDIEYNYMLNVLGGRNHGTYNGHDISIYHSGIGKVNAAIGTLSIINAIHPDIILSTGMAGAVSSSVDLRSVVLGRQVAYHDVYCGSECLPGQVQGMPQFFEGYQPLIDVALSTNEPGVPARAVQGLICTGDQFITDVNGIKVIADKFPQALACEMESAAIAHVCYVYNMPFLAIRIISDTPGRTVDHQLQWEDFLANMGKNSFLWMRNFLAAIPPNLSVTKK